MPDSNSYQHSEGVMLVPHTPVVDFEEQKKRHLCLALNIGAAFFILVGILVVWNAYTRREAHMAQRNANMAAAALSVLNKHLHAQSKAISNGCETTLLILRHCEKYGPYVMDKDGNEHCSYVGYERASYLTTLFGDHGERWPSPAHLFSLKPDRDGHWNFREWETLLPLSKKLEMTIDVTSREDFAKEYFDLLQSGTQCGQVAVISWKHEFIPGLAVSLGCGPENGCPATFDEDDFDSVWQLKFVFHPIQDIYYDSESDMSHNSTTRRRLQKAWSNRGWNIYATVTKQNFDPLQFSKKVGDYPPGGTSKGGGWNHNEL